MPELKKKLDGARPHCLPRALVLINPGNPTGTLNVHLFAVRVIGGMSLRNGMWHGLRNGIIMRNLIYADRFQRNKLN